MKRAGSAGPSFNQPLAQLRGRLRLAQHRRVVGEAGHHCRGLLEVFGFDVVLGIQMGVVDVGEVVQTVLDKLEAGQAEAIEGDMVGGAGVAGHHRGSAHVIERLQVTGQVQVTGSR